MCDVVASSEQQNTGVNGKQTDVGIGRRRDLNAQLSAGLGDVSAKVTCHLKKREKEVNIMNSYTHRVINSKIQFIIPHALLQIYIIVSSLYLYAGLTGRPIIFRTYKSAQGRIFE